MGLNKKAYDAFFYSRAGSRQIETAGKLHKSKNFPCCLMEKSIYSYEPLPEKTPG
jgi:hypothetical protein